MKKDQIVAVGLLTQRDLDVLGTGFHRLFAVDQSDDEGDDFADLIAQLDRIEATKPDAAQTAASRDALHARMRPFRQAQDALKARRPA